MSMIQASAPQSLYASSPLAGIVAPTMHRARKGLRRLVDIRMSYAAGAELMWFISAVIVGLALAGWLAGLAGVQTPPSPTPDILIL